MARHALGSVFVVSVAALGLVFASGCRQKSSSASPGDPAAAAVGTTGERSSAVPDGRGDRGDVMTTSLFRTIAKRENPVVVAITTQARVTTPDVTQFFGDDDFFSRFFGGARPPRAEIRRSLGSGFLINSDGEILTNNHVVAGAEQIRVALYSDEHKTYAADVVGRDPLTDSALIRLKDAPSNLPTAALGDSDALEPGDWVMAIGNPFELGHTVTVGVISYKGRPFATTEGRFQNMLQTDASINPGNSGGPLIDVHGQVIGINTAILAGSENAGNVGIGFAVPINTVKTLLPQLRKGEVQRGQLGVQILSTPITDDEAKQLGLPDAKGAVVSRVQPGSAADRAGLQAGDVIVEYNGNPVPDSDHLTTMVANTPAGTEVPIVFYRNGKEQHTKARIEKLQLEGSDEEAGRDHGTAPGFGLSLGDITPDIAGQLRLPSGTRGAVVQGIEPFTPASNAGLRPGDVILEVNRQPVHSAADASRQLRSVKAGQVAFLLVLRNGVRQFVEMRKE